MAEEEDGTIALQFASGEMRTIEQVAAARGRTVEEYILTEALRQARELLGAAVQSTEGDPCLPN